jgi:hypothetical protein
MQQNTLRGGLRVNDLRAGRAEPQIIGKPLSAKRHMYTITLVAQWFGTVEDSASAMRPKGLAFATIPKPPACRKVAIPSEKAETPLVIGTAGSLRVFR